jgi:hypothetical protein
VDAQIAVVACGGGGPDFITVIDWLATGNGDAPTIENAAYKTFYLSAPRPNPARDYVSFEYWIANDYTGNVTAILSDQHGRAIKTKILTGNTGKGSFSFNVSGLSPGIYLITLSTDTHSVSKKVLAE